MSEGALTAVTMAAIVLPMVGAFSAMTYGFHRMDQGREPTSAQMAVLMLAFVLISPLLTLYWIGRFLNFLVVGVAQWLDELRPVHTVAAPDAVLQEAEREVERLLA